MYLTMYRIYIIFLLLLPVAVSTTDTSTNLFADTVGTTKSPMVSSTINTEGSTNSFSERSGMSNSATLPITEIETTDTSSTKEAVPKTPNGFSWTSHFGANVTFNFTVDGSVAFCNVTVQGVNFTKTNVTGDCGNLPVSGLKNGTTYNVTVTAHMANQTSGPATFNFTTDETASQPVRDLVVVAVNSTSLNVTWQRPEEVNGILRGYGLRVRQGIQCVQVIVYGAVDQSNGTKRCEINATEKIEDCTNRTTECGEIQNQKQEIIVTGLYPDTSYNITVYAINGAAENSGAGQLFTCNGTTLTAVPSNITTFISDSITENSVSLTWSPPEPRPGPTNYSLVITDLGSRYYNYSETGSPTTTLITGYDNITYIVRNLRPAWNYSFSLSAHTERGSSGNLTTSISTNNSAPGTVQNLTVTPGQEAFKNLTARWRCPRVGERHSLIRGFIVNTTIVGLGPGCDISLGYTSPEIKKTTQANQTMHRNSNSVFVNLNDSSCQGYQSFVINVEPENHYLIQVQSVGDEYSTDWANTTYCAPAGPSGSVRNLSVTVLNASDLIVMWVEPEETNGMLYGYNILVNDGIVCDQKIYMNFSANCKTDAAKSIEQQKRLGEHCKNRSVVCADLKNLQITITDLLPDTLYNITVFAINGATQNNGYGSPASFNKTTGIDVPSNINNFTAKGIASTSMNLSWSPPVPRPGPTNYTLIITDLGPRYYNYSKAGSPNITFIPGYDSHEHFVNELRPAWIYNFTLSAQTAKGSSQNITTTQHTNDSVPGAVQNLTVTPDVEAYKQQIASWRCPGVTERNTHIIGFLLIVRNGDYKNKDKERSTSTEFDAQSVHKTNQCSGDISFVNLTDDSCESNQSVVIVVKPETHYLIQVQTVGEKYNSTELVNTTFDTPAGPSGPVENLSANSLNGSAVSVEWGQPNETNGVLRGYDVQVLKHGQECVQRIWYRLKTTNITGNDCFDTGRKEKCDHCAKVKEINGDINNSKQRVTIADLLPDTWYTVTVFAINGAAQNNGAGVPASTNVTTDICVPSSPTHFTATLITTNSITLTWTPPEPRPGPTNYTLVITDLGSLYYRDGVRDSTNVTHIQGYESQNYTVTGLRPAWNYSFSLSAQTERGSSQNVTFIQVTNDSVPGAAQYLTVTPGLSAYKQLTASWRCPSVTDRNTLIRGFLVNTTLVGRSGDEDTGCQKKESRVTYTTPDSQKINCDIGLCFLNLTGSCEGNNTVTIAVRPESQHLIQVQTVGENFNSTDWVNETYDTPAGPSGPVDNLELTYLNESDVRVQWGYPTETNGLLLGYGLLVFKDGNTCVRSMWYQPRSEKGCFKDKCADGHKELYNFKEVCKETETRSTEALTPDRTEVMISNLHPYTSYNITVFAVNCAKDNNGEGQPASLNVVTNMSASDPVKNLSVVALSDSVLKVTWYKPGEINGVLRGYGLLVLRNGTKCVQAIKYTNDTKTCNTTESKAKERHDKFGEQCANGTEICGDIENLEQEVNITDLLPDTMYTITVFAINDAVQTRGEGQTVKTSGTTNIAAPSNVTDFTAVFINNDVTLTWSPPEPRPGPTTYTLVITDLGSRYYRDSETSLTSKTIYIQGYDNASYIEKSLRSAWNYTFRLSAHTERGSSENTSFTISTNDSEPGPVQNLTLTPGTVPYKGVTVTWRCPAVTARNTRITGFAVRKTLVVSEKQNFDIDIYTTSITNDHNCESTKSIDLELTPESKFLIEVFTLGEHFNDTQGVRESYNTSAGSPPITNVKFHSGQEHQSQTSFPISFCAPCLFDESNGKIDYFAIIVCAVEKCAQKKELYSELKVKDVHSWHIASDNDFKEIYRPTNDTWQNYMRNLTGKARRKRSTDSYEYVVGEDNDCASKPSGTYCNGPLPAGRSFRVLVVSCTAGGCSSSELSEELHTLDAENSLSTAAIAGLAVGIVVVIFLVVIIAVCKHRLQAKRNGKGKGRQRDLSTRERVDNTELTNLSKKRPILMKDFLDKMTDLRSSPMSDGSTPFSLVLEYEEIKELSPKHPQESARMDSNKGKNRYTNILPFDHSRVQLKQVAGDQCSDYINANFIPGYYSNHEYIATQGPLEHTVDDFWRMVWEQGVPVIVMLSDFVDKGVKKVFPYFPGDDKVNEPQAFGSIRVTLTQVQKLSGFSLRTFTLQRGKSKRQVQHFFIENWIDHGANLDLQFLLQFVKKVRTEIPPGSESPMVVHCSAGVGRTGTLIGLDYLMQYIDNTPLSDPIDIFSYVLSMRDCRTTMVQTAEQYVVLYLAAEKLLMYKTGKDNYQEPVYANLAYEDTDEKPEYANMSSPGALDGAAAEQTATEMRLSRHLSTDSCHSTAKLIPETQKKKSTRPSRPAPKAPPVHEKARRVAQQQSTATTTANRFSTDLTSSTAVTLASEPTEGTDRTFEIGTLTNVKQEDPAPTKSPDAMESPEKASLCAGSEISAPVATESAPRKNGSSSSAQKSSRPVPPDRKKRSDDEPSDAVDSFK